MPKNKNFRLRPKADRGLENIYDYSLQAFGRASVRRTISVAEPAKIVDARQTRADQHMRDVDTVNKI